MPLSKRHFAVSWGEIREKKREKGTRYLRGGFVSFFFFFYKIGSAVWTGFAVHSTQAVEVKGTFI